MPNREGYELAKEYLQPIPMLENMVLILTHSTATNKKIG